MHDDFLSGLENKIYRSTLCDGLLDMYCGLMFIAAGLVPVLKAYGISGFITVALMVPPIVALVPLGKHYVTERRLGIVRPGPGRRERKKKMRYVYILVAVVSAVLAILAVSGVYSRIWSGYFKASLLGFYISIALGLTAYFSDFRRLYILAFIGGIGMPLHEYFGNSMGRGRSAALLFCLPGLVFTVFGIVLFYRFVRRYRPECETGGAA